MARLVTLPDPPTEDRFIARSELNALVLALDPLPGWEGRLKNRLSRLQRKGVALADGRAGWRLPAAEVSGLTAHAAAVCPTHGRMAPGGKGYRCIPCAETCVVHGPGMKRRRGKSMRCAECREPTLVVARRAWVNRNLLLRKYGIAEAEYEALFESQGGRCACCDATTFDDATDRRLGVDHDHESGLVRGLLCHRCNRTLGYVADDPELLERLAAYLREPPARRVLDQREGGVA